MSGSVCVSQEFMWMDLAASCFRYSCNSVMCVTVCKSSRSVFVALRMHASCIVMCWENDASWFLNCVSTKSVQYGHCILKINVISVRVL